MHSMGPCHHDSSIQISLSNVGVLATLDILILTLGDSPKAGVHDVLSALIAGLSRDQEECVVQVVEAVLTSTSSDRGAYRHPVPNSCQARCQHHHVQRAFLLEHGRFEAPHILEQLQ